MTNNKPRHILPHPAVIALTMMVLWLSAMPAAAQQSGKSREAENAQMVSIGAVNLLDTYLSPEKYKGTELRYISHTMRYRPSKRWNRRITHYGTFATTNDRNDKGSLTEGLYTLDLAFNRQFNLAGGHLQLMVGGMADLNIGAVYNSRNQNNPAQMRLSMQVGPTVAARLGFRLFNSPMALRYEASVPVVGLMFSPNYGQSYYEIFSRGNYDHNVVLTTPANAPSVRQLATLDFRLFGATWRIGYLGDIQQAKANHLKQHAYTHAVVIGFVRNLQITYRR